MFARIGFKVRKTSLNTVYQIAKNNPQVVFIGSDLGQGTLDSFRKEMPERFFMEGVSEAHIIGMAAGLAMNGKIVYVNTISTFLTRRCFEQCVIDLGLAKLNVRLLGNGGGLVYAPLGPTHLATDDCAIMRTIPNMSVIVPCDAVEMAEAIKASENYQGPMYIRIAKGGERVVSDYIPNGESFVIGKSRRYGHQTDALSDVLLFTTGVMLEKALEVYKFYHAKGINVKIVHCPTLKPFDYETAVQEILKSKMVLSIEEHIISGGLGSIIAEIISEKTLIKKMPLFFKRLGIPDAFPDKYGSQSKLMKYYQIDYDGIMKTIEMAMGKL